MQTRKPYVTTKHFDVRLFDRQGEEIGKDTERIYSVEYTEFQDAVDLIPYFRAHGRLFIVVIESCKPALLLRPSVVTVMKDVDDEEKTGYIIEQPSAVIQNKKNEYSVHETLERIFREKLPGVVPLGDPIVLGGSYFPSVGSSTELVFPRAVEIVPNMAYMNKASISKAYVMDVEELLRIYFHQEKAISTRLLELVFRLMDKLSYTPVSPSIGKITTNFSYESVLHKNRFMTRENLRTIIEENNEEGSVASVSLTEVEKPKTPFLMTTHFRTKVVTLDGEEEQREVDVLIRKNIDSIDIGGYFAVDGKLYMPIKWGVRPALSVRNLMPHPVHTDVSLYFVEGIAGSLEGESSKSALLERGEIEAQEEVSLPPLGASRYIGFDYPSPGHNPERVYRMLLELDPTQEVNVQSHEEETVRIVYASVEDVILLAHEGIVRDPRLSLNAHLLKLLYQNTHYEVPQMVKEEYDTLFETLVAKPSQVQAWLSKNSGAVDSILSESSLYRKLKAYGENELGVAVMTLNHEQEAHFFSPMVPLFATPATNQEDKLPFYYLHDLFHYATTGFIPLIRSGGKVDICSFEDYMRATAGNECEAVWYSDVLIPQEFGVDRAEQIFNGDSVARAFDELSVNTNEAREIIREIELHGVIPNVLKNHPLFKRYASVFIGRLLRYHVMDTDNCKSMYEYWKNNLDIAEVMEDFCDVFSSVEEYEAYYQKTVTSITTYTEGVNPLRAYVSQLLNVRLRLLALKLAYVKHEAHLVGQQEIDKAIVLLLARMKVAYQSIARSRKEITNIDPTHKNKKIIHDANQIETGVIKEAEEYLESLLESTLPQQVKENIKHRTVPFFEPFRDIDKQFLEEELALLMKQNALI